MPTITAKDEKLITAELRRVAAIGAQDAAMKQLAAKAGIDVEVKAEDLRDHDVYRLAMYVEDPALAEYYLDRMIAWYATRYQLRGLNGPVIAEIEVKNRLACLAADRGDVIRERVERLYDVAHPTYGWFRDTGPLTAEQKAALQAGVWDRVLEANRYRRNPYDHTRALPELQTAREDEDDED